MAEIKQFIVEPTRSTPVKSDYDVIVCGGGPSGWAAAVRAAREGCRTLLLERCGCLGGIWTGGLMPWIIDHRNKTGLMAKLREYLLQHSGYCAANDTLTGPPETLKFYLETQALQVGVDIRYGTLMVDSVREDRRLIAVITESKSGREAWTGHFFIDATGDGDLAARSGCGFDYGDGNGETQPASLIALLGGVDPAEIPSYMVSPEGKRELFELLKSCGVSPSYEHPSLFDFGGGILGLMSHHAYRTCAFDASSRTRAILQGRAEIHRQVEALRHLGGVWRSLHLIMTADQLGVREGRRIHGRDQVTAADLNSSAPRRPLVCVSRSCVDVHSPDPQNSRSIMKTPLINSAGLPIPYLALISADIDNLLLAGRCISGDFWMHASYRVTGNAVPIGEAAGYIAARAFKSGIDPWKNADLPMFSTEF